MPFINATRKRQDRLLRQPVFFVEKILSPFFAGSCVWLFGAGLYFCYRFGFSAAFQFDDSANLSWLAQFDDSIYALTQVFSGSSGPLGRPAALMSFLIDGYYWPFDSVPFHRTNTLLHLLNSCLLILFLGRMQVLAGKSSRPGLVIVAACFWAALPLSVSTVMLTVQRMTLLSATFSLAGIGIYLVGRARLSDEPYFGMLLMASAICLFTPLAILSKENGALLPLYIAVIEISLLPPFPDNFHKWQKMVLRLLIAVPVILLFAYLGQLLWHFDALTASYSSRDFTFSERLQTEAVILWEYLRLAFLPDLAALGPFQDAHPVYSVATHPVLVLSSCFAWLLAAVIAVCMRKVTPLPLFGLCWFLAGHVLESTVIPLELYFEHRNYLPLIGPVYALIVGIGQLIKTAAVRYIALSAYLSIQLFMLLQTTQLWGDPLKSARYWAEKQPDSIRAVQFLAQQLMQRQRLPEASQVLEQAAARHRDDATLMLQKLQLQCEMRTLPPALLDLSLERMQYAHYSAAVIPTLKALAELTDAKRCAALTISRFHALLDVLLQNNAFGGHTAYHLHHLKASIYEHQRQITPAINELEAALNIDPSLDTYLRISSILIDAGYYEAARRPLADARLHLPSNPFVRQYWLQQLDAYHQEIDAYLSVHDDDST